jgi:hypothetical protein
MYASGEMQGDGFLTDLKRWGSHPFSSDMKLWPDFFMLVGVFIIFAVIWNIILRHLLEALSNA